MCSVAATDCSVGPGANEGGLFWIGAGVVVDMVGRSSRPRSEGGNFLEFMMVDTRLCRYLMANVKKSDDLPTNLCEYNKKLVSLEVLPC